MLENELYLIASLVAFSAFLVSLYFCMTKKINSPYGIYPILILGLIVLAKSIELYEKHIFKLSNNH